MAWKGQLLERGWIPQVMSVSTQEVSERSLSDVPVGFLLELSNFPLSVRARGCLEQLGFERVGDLATSNELDLLDAKNLGRKTVRELQAALSSLGLTLGMDGASWRAADHVDLTKRHSASLAKLRRGLRRRLYGVNSLTIEDEIASAIGGAVPEADRARVEHWLGLDQPSAPTLQQVGDATGVTRERIRQIVLRAQKQIRLAGLDMPKLRGAVAALESAHILSERAASELLRGRVLSKSPVSVSGLIRVADLFGIKTRLLYAEVDEQRFIGTRRSLTVLKTVRRAGRRAVEQWRCSTLEDVTAGVSAKDAGVT
jgi:Bacterial RNA polymerase, alpha chain C terminal domain